MPDTFEQLIHQCDMAGEPFQCLTRKAGGAYQVSIRSKYSNGGHNAFTCANGATPTEAMRNIVAQRKIAHTQYEEEDPLS